MRLRSRKNISLDKRVFIRSAALLLLCIVYTSQAFATTVRKLIKEVHVSSFRSADDKYYYDINEEWIKQQKSLIESKEYEHIVYEFSLEKPLIQKNKPSLFEFGSGFGLVEIIGLNKEPPKNTWANRLLEKLGIAIPSYWGFKKAYKAFKISHTINESKIIDILKIHGISKIKAKSIAPTLTKIIRSSAIRTTLVFVMASSATALVIEIAKDTEKQKTSDRRTQIITSIIMGAVISILYLLLRKHGWFIKS